MKTIKLIKDTVLCAKENSIVLVDETQFNLIRNNCIESDTPIENEAAEWVGERDKLLQDLSEATSLNQALEEKAKLIEDNLEGIRLENENLKTSIDEFKVDIENLNAISKGVKEENDLLIDEAKKLKDEIVKLKKQIKQADK
ncbi:MAG: hypothetical protein ACK5L6_07525 [Anaerorhabdus sp.]|uniref:hypothetical protein n=1 Tax=Anaerorhabdus sp. TaxID=1872524 RepID=UPI003A850AB3